MMYYFFNGNGEKLKVCPEQVYQGSNNASTLYFIAPFSLSSTVTATFTLPDDTTVSPILLYSDGIIPYTETGGSTLCFGVWKTSLFSSLTSKIGCVKVSFSVNSLTETITTEQVYFLVSKGSAPSLPLTPTQNVYDSILSALQTANADYLEIKSDLTTIESAVDGKVSKSSSENIIYATDSNGDQTTVNYSVNGGNGNGGSVVVRNSNGDISDLSDLDVKYVSVKPNGVQNLFDNNGKISDSYLTDKSSFITDITEGDFNSIVSLGERNVVWTNNTLHKPFALTDGYEKGILSVYTDLHSGVQTVYQTYYGTYIYKRYATEQNNQSVWSDWQKLNLVTDTEKNTWDAKQNALTFDTAPTSGSNNPVTSSGIKTAIDNAISSVYRYKGSVSTYNDLPSTSLTVGDVYNVESTGDNYAWTGTAWDKLAGTVDLSGYVHITRTINGQALSSNITITKADVGLGNVHNRDIDNTPTENSTNYITSGAVYNAINNLPIKTIYTAAYDNDFNNIGTTSALPTGEYFVYFLGSTSNIPPLIGSGIVSDHLWLEVEKQYYSDDHYLIHQFVSLGESFYHRYADVDNDVITWNNWEVSKINPNVVTDTVNTTQSFTAANNTEYYFGTLTSLTVTFPTGNTGDLVQINFTGTDNMTVTLGSNVTSLDTTFKANTRYSITAQKDNDLWWLLCVERELTNNA